MPRPALPSPAFPTAPRPCASTTSCAAHVEAALGGLTLQSPDPAKRIEAAQSVFKTHDETMLPAIDSALKKETNKDAKQASPKRAPRSCCSRKTPPSTKPVFIGEIKGNGQFDVVWKTPGLVAGDAWSKELPDSKDLIGDWVGKKCGNYNTKTNKCGGQGS